MRARVFWVAYAPRYDAQLMDADHPETSCHNYTSVNDTLDMSDHSPIYCTWLLKVRDSTHPCAPCG